MEERLKARTGEPFDDELDQMYRNAAKAKPTLDKIVEQVARETNGTAKTADLKSRARAVDKIKSDYGGDASSIKDIARATAVNKNPDAVVKRLEQIFGVGPKRNTFGQQTISGYQDAMFKVSVDGTIVEIQVHHPKMILAKEKEHHLYVRAERIRRTAAQQNREPNLEELKKLEELTKQRRKIYSD